MPNWKKLIVSGSDASLNSLTVATSVNAQSFTGSLFGTASWAEYTTTASFVTSSNVFGPFGPDSILSASYALTASFALNVSDNGFIYTQGSPSDTWIITHNLQTTVPLVQVYDSLYSQIIPSSVSASTANTVEVTFAYPVTGYAIISKGSGVSSTTSISSSYAVSASFATTASYASTVGFNFEQISPLDTWTINHNLNNRHPLVQIYDSGHLTVIPQSISGSTVNTSIVTFAYPISGYARIV